MSLTKVSYSMITGAVVNVLDYGADPTGSVDSTAAIQAALDVAPVASSGQIVFFPAGAYKFSKLTFKHNNTILRGEGQRSTYLTSTATGGSVIANNDQTTTLYYCGVEGMQISAQSISSSGTKIIDWRSIQFGFIRNVWVYGNNTAGLAGIYLGVLTFGLQECTYNFVENIYIGGVGYGILFYDGANTNTFINCRVQPGPSAYGYHLAFGTAADRIGNNTFISCHCEYPGNTVTGYALGTGAKNTTIIAPRLEGLATGLEITAAAANTCAVNPYFDSNTTNVSNASTSLSIVGANTFLLQSSKDSPGWGYEAEFYGYPGAITRYKNAAGGYHSYYNNSTAALTNGCYGSAYGGGTVFGVGANGFYSSVEIGNYAVGTTGLTWLGLGSNGTVRAKVQSNGALNFVPLAADPVGAVAGDVYYNSSTNKLRCYNGSTWNDLF